MLGELDASDGIRRRRPGIEKFKPLATEQGMSRPIQPLAASTAIPRRLATRTTPGQLLAHNAEVLQRDIPSPLRHDDQ